MSEENKDRSENQFYGVLFCIVSAFFFALSFYASTVWETAGNIFIGGSFMVSGVWLIKTKKIYWTVSEGFTPKEEG